MAARMIHTEEWSDSTVNRVRSINPGLAVLKLDTLPVASQSYYSDFGPDDLFFLRVHMSPPHVQASALLRFFFKWQEYSNLVRGFSQVFPRRQFLNPPPSAFTGGSKPLQLATARRVGLSTPDTLFTNSKRQALQFVREQAVLGSRCVIKTIDTPLAPNPEKEQDTLILFTRELTARELEGDDADDFGTPVTVQKLIPKSHELRVCVFGRHSVAFRIDSQKYERTSIDWRWRVPDASVLIYEELDESLALRLKQYLSALDLDVGVFDVAVTPAGESIFLECNPYGQWQAMDELLGGKAADALGFCIRDAIAAWKSS